MYEQVRKNIAAGIPPFNDSVLYPIQEATKEVLTAFIKDVLSLQDEKIYTALDCFELSYESIHEKKELAVLEIPELITLKSGTFMGFFDEKISFYLRASAEPLEDISETEGSLGSFELYAVAPFLEKAKTIAREKYDLFVTSEGAWPFLFMKMP